MFKTLVRTFIFPLTLLFGLSGVASAGPISTDPADWQGLEPEIIDELDDYNTGNTIAATEDELTMIFCDPAHHNIGCQGGFDLWIATRNSKDEEWGVPQNMNGFQVSGLARKNQFNTAANNWPPAINGDGTILVWEDKRKPSNPDANYANKIWISLKLTDVSQLTNPDDPFYKAYHDDWGSSFGSWSVGKWGPAVNIDYYNQKLGGGNLNSSGSSTDGDPEISKDGLELYISTEREGDRDIWIATRNSLSEPFTNLKNLDDYNVDRGGSPLNYGGEDENPAISADGLTMFFLSKRDGGWDVFITTRKSLDAPWGEPVNVCEDLLLQPEGLSGNQWGIDFAGDSLYLTHQGKIHIIENIPSGSPITIISVVDQGGIRRLVKAYYKPSTATIIYWEEYKGNLEQHIPPKFWHLF
ncbi:MAG: hypothetical protein AB1797_03550 [bacterium]